jgi:hypothetical protein
MRDILSTIIVNLLYEIHAGFNIRILLIITTFFQLLPRHQYVHQMIQALCGWPEEQIVG